MAEAIDSVVWNSGVMQSILMRNVEDGLSSLNASLALYAAVGGPFPIGMHVPNLMHGVRGYGIDSSSYSTSMGIDLVCEDQPWSYGI